jgi:phage terminase large subunit-like protein
MAQSAAERLAGLGGEDRSKILAGLSKAQLDGLMWDWRFWGRPEQFQPPGNWMTWLILAGRGFGKTRAGAEWVRSQVCGATPLKGGVARWVSIVAETAGDARDVLVEGPAGLLAIHPPDHRPQYEPSKRRLTWPNGAVAMLYNATEPDQLRGPQADLAWADELAKWQYAQETWDMLQFGLRLGENPRQIVTTTPRPIPVVRQLMKDSLGEKPTCVVTRGSTFDNASNLAPKFLEQIERRYAGTRLGRQELNAEILDDAPDALWTRAGLDEHRRKVGETPTLKRIVVAVDPAAKTNELLEEGAATGICVVGIGDDNRGYVLDDGTVRASPNGWARRAVALFDRYDADCIVGEVNQGGDMVESTIRSVRPSVPYRAVHATRGKWVRAEPIAALYEQGRVSHVGTFAELEDEMVLFGPNGMADGLSPDRMDALVWALTELFPQMTRRAPRPTSIRIESAAGYRPHQQAYRPH